MKLQPKEQLARSMEQLNLPSQVIGSEFIELQGNRQVLVCGQKGIRCYQEQEIIIELAHCALRIQGSSLSIVTMTTQEILIRGTIDSVGFLK